MQIVLFLLLLFRGYFCGQCMWANVSLLQIELQLATSKRLTWPADINLKRIELNRRKKILGICIYKITTKYIHYISNTLFFPLFTACIPRQQLGRNTHTHNEKKRSKLYLSSAQRLNKFLFFQLWQCEDVEEEEELEKLLPTGISQQFAMLLVHQSKNLVNPMRNGAYLHMDH